MDTISPEAQKFGSWLVGLIGGAFGIVGTVRAGRKARRDATEAQIKSAIAPMLAVFTIIQNDLTGIKEEMGCAREDIAKLHGIIEGRREGDAMVVPSERQKRNARLTTS